jgi:uncharacterized protein YcbX
MILCYQGTFTDDRNFEVIKPEGEIVRTKLYEDKHNTQSSSGTYFCRKREIYQEKITISEDHNQKSAITKSSYRKKEAHYKRY